MKSNIFIITILILTFGIFISQGYQFHKENSRRLATIEDSLSRVVDSTPWVGSNAEQLPLQGKDADLICYGYNLIAHTSRYLGPNGSVKINNNAMNCQNCHLEGGTKPFGNNFGKVFATYPQYRSRNDGVQTVMMRLQDCFQRSMNGNALDSTSREMRAIYAYIKWLDASVPEGSKPIGTKLPTLPYLDRAADPQKGETIFISNCKSCHGADGQGQYDSEKREFLYPPIWGKQSFNDGAGLARIGSLAAFIHYNMPNGTKYDQPAMSVEDSWDVAAYILAQSRPHFDQRNDFKILKKKPIDDPIGPYLDSFSVRQHTYGPFKPIKQFYTSINNKK